jgi:hypothetical protein
MASCHAARRVLSGAASGVQIPDPSVKYGFISDPTSLTARVRYTIDGDQVRRITQRDVFVIGSPMDGLEGVGHPRIKLVKYLLAAPVVVRISLHIQSMC